MIESGEYPSITELAKAEKINQSYACRLLRLTLLAPGIIEMLLNGTQPKELQLGDVLRPLPADWPSQKRLLKFDQRQLSAQQCETQIALDVD
jgi:hypothetical protein